MLQRIIKHLNKHLISDVNDLSNSEDSSHELKIFEARPPQIPARTVREYCYLLSKAGYLYTYSGCYVRSQRLPESLTITMLQRSEMDKETELMHDYNRLHGLPYPNVDSRLKKGLRIIDHLHLMQFTKTEFHLYDFWDFIDTNIFSLLPMFKKFIEFGYLKGKGNNEYVFTGKYVPFSVGIKDLVLFEEGRLDVCKQNQIKQKVVDELELIENHGVVEAQKRVFNVKAVDNINWVRSLVSEYGYLDARGRIVFTKGFYDAIGVFDNYSKRVCYE